jgi:FXSXX-COOH protein
MAGSNMNEDIADGGLIDVSELDLGELLTEADDSSLTKALNRILAVGENGESHWFQASI